MARTRLHLFTSCQRRLLKQKTIYLKYTSFELCIQNRIFVYISTKCVYEIPKSHTYKQKNGE